MKKQPGDINFTAGHITDFLLSTFFLKSGLNIFHGIVIIIHYKDYISNHINQHIYRTKRISKLPKNEVKSLQKVEKNKNVGEKEIHFQEHLRRKRILS